MSKITIVRDSEGILSNAKLTYVYLDHFVKFRGGRVNAKRFAIDLHKATGFPVFVVKKSGKTVEWKIGSEGEHVSRKLRAAQLLNRIANLNPDAEEIGAGMLKQLISEARAVTNWKP